MPCLSVAAPSSSSTRLREAGFQHRAGHELAHARHDLRPVELDRRHDLFVCQSRHAELEVEAAGLEVSEVADDLPGDGFGRADVESAVGPVSYSKDSSVGGLKPRSLPMRVIVACQCGQNASRASSSVAATWPGPWMPIGRGGCPSSSRASRKSCEKGAKRAGGPRDDREHEREAVAGRADHGLGAAADADPDRERPVLEMWDDFLLVQGGAGRSIPGDGAAFHQLGEEVRLLCEQTLVVGEVVAEQGERLDARATPRMTSARPPETASRVE